MRPFLYLAFFLSGAAGLIYESVWTRYLGLILGHTAQAQVLVLTVFLGGMAVGAAVTGRYSAAIRSPLLWYAAAEVLIGIFGFAFHDLFRGASTFSYDVLFPALGESRGAAAAGKSIVAAALILPQSILLGATFPLMAAAVLRQAPGRAGWTLGWLYFLNSIGAAIGVLFGAFYLLPRAALPGTLVVAGALNVVAAVLTIVAARAVPRPSTQRAEPAPIPLESVTQAQAPWPAQRALLLVVAFGTALASFAYEIAWIRMLSLVLGSATHSFELMLSAFILGLAIGAVVIGAIGDRLTNPVRTLAYIQCAMGALAALTLPLYVASFGWTAGLLDTFAKTPQGYAGFTVARYAICLAVMLPATICAGMTLPLITKILYRSGEREGAVGEVYGANTAGSIVGVQLAALVLLPLIGTKALLLSASVIDIALGVLLLVVAARRSGGWAASGAKRALVAAPAAALLLVAAGAFAADFDTRLLSSGVYRTGRIDNVGGWRTITHRDGRTATVTVRRSAMGDLVLTTNGKPDASLPFAWTRADTTDGARVPLMADLATQLLLPVLALAHNPDARTAAVVGHGSGLTTHVLLGSPHAARVTTIEIEPQIYHASFAFLPYNRRAFDDPRSHLVVDDARAYFASRRAAFDLIVSEPSNPWVSGVSSLFTTEFYERVKLHLTPGGVFTQWLNLYEMDDALVRSVLAALASAFPSFAVYMTSAVDIVIVAAAGDSIPTPDWSVAQAPDIRADFARAPSLTPDALASLFAGDSRLLGPYLRGAKANSDYDPVLDLGAERARYLGTSSAGMKSLGSPSYDFASALSDRRLPLPSSASVPADVPRLRTRAVAARSRNSRPSEAMDDAELAAWQRRRAHDDVVASGRPPADWGIWIRNLIQVDRDLHAGSAGVVDTQFFAPVYRYMRRVAPPAGVRATVAFLHAANSWDFDEAARAADTLIALGQRGAGWVPRELLRDAAVTARLRLGDGRGAMRAYSALSSAESPGSAEHFRSQVLLALILESIARGDSAARQGQRLR